LFTFKTTPLILLSIFILFLLFGCTKNNKHEVVVYTSVDQVYASKIFKQFEEDTGIRVLAVYDTEASKAVGLEKRLLIEKKHPKADVFWNSEPVRTARLAQEEVFAPCMTLQIPSYKHAFYKDPQSRWFALGERVRVILVNTAHISPENYPDSFMSLWDGRFKDQIAVSTPYIGTAATHFAALYHMLGETKFVDLITHIKNNRTAFLAGNSVVKDAVGEGRFPIGVVDSDDALAAIREKLPVKMLYYDQNGSGDFAIFGTVAKIKNGPNPENAERFMQYLLTRETEEKLIRMGAVQFSVFEKNDKEEIKRWTIDPYELVNDLKRSTAIFKEML